MCQEFLSWFVVLDIYQVASPYCMTYCSNCRVVLEELTANHEVAALFIYPLSVLSRVFIALFDAHSRDDRSR